MKHVEEVYDRIEINLFLLTDDINIYIIFVKGN
jgi:hypothetical protein